MPDTLHDILNAGELEEFLVFTDIQPSSDAGQWRERPGLEDSTQKIGRDQVQMDGLVEDPANVLYDKSSPMTH